MSKKERDRLRIMQAVVDKKMSIKTASEILRLSYRQTRRVYARYLLLGDAGLIHLSRGRSSNRGTPAKLKDEAISLYQKKYDGFGPTLASEKLASEGYAVDHETLRRWLMSAGIIKKQRKSTVHRSRRQRKEYFGELVQMDGSHHKWFEGRAKESCLINMIDDATNTTRSFMDQGETTEGAMRLLWSWISSYGIPQALYVDKKNVFVTSRQPTIEEELRGEMPLTQFSRACKKLGIRIICANSPQAKGRVERRHAVFQDRFVKELMLENITTIKGANKLLEDFFTGLINEKFSVKPSREMDRHRPADGIDLASVFCFENERVISNDFTIRYKGRIFQILKQPELPRPRSKIIVSRRLDGSMHLIHKERELLFEEIMEKEKQPMMIEDAPKVTKTKAHTPPPDHPWRGRFKSPEKGASI